MKIYTTLQSFFLNFTSVSSDNQHCEQQLKLTRNLEDMKFEYLGNKKNNTNTFFATLLGIPLASLGHQKTTQNYIKK